MTDIDDDPLFADPPKKSAKRAAPRHPRITGEFASVPLAWLKDRRRDDVFPGKMRLYLYLLISSRHGRRTVRLTNEMCAEIGLSRQCKSNYLRWLEEEGFIAISRDGTATPTVAMSTGPKWRPL
jgi:hypothetical protein